MDKLFRCSCCGSQNSLQGKELQKIALHCSHCGRAVKHWSCHRHRCEVTIWTKTRRNYVCTKCTTSEFKVPCESNDISMLALSLSLELYYKCKTLLVSDAEGDMLIELWRKARVSGTDFVRAAAKEAAAAAYRESQTADFVWSASERTETATRTMLAQLARNQARARARASVSAASPDSSGLTHSRRSRVQLRSFNGGQENFNASSDPRTRNSPVHHGSNSKESTGFRIDSRDKKEASGPRHTSRRRQGNESSKISRPVLCDCKCQ